MCVKNNGYIYDFSPLLNMPTTQPFYLKKKQVLLLSSNSNSSRAFSEVSGLKINIDKAECMEIGRLRDIKRDVHGIKINEKPIKYLGIYVGNDPEEWN